MNRNKTSFRLNERNSNNVSFELNTNVDFQLEHFGCVIYKKRLFDFAELDHLGTLVGHLIKNNQICFSNLIELLADHYKKSKLKIKKDLIVFINDLLAKDFLIVKKKPTNYVSKDAFIELVNELEGKWEKLPETKFYSTPLQFHWEITQQCNLRCIHCYASAKNVRRSEADTIDWDKSMRLLDNLKMMGVVQINFLGGEPLVEKKFFPLLKKTVDYGIDITFPTNGVLLNEDNIRELKKLGLEYLTISLDSSNSSTFEKLRGVKGIHQKVNNNIILAKKMGLKIVINAVLTKLNWREFPELIDLLVRLKVDVLKVIDEFPVGRGMQNVDKLQLTPDEYKEFYEVMLNDVKPKFDNKLEIRLSPRFTFLEKNPSGLKSSDGLDYRCSAGRAQTFCTYDGDIYPCYLFYGENEFVIGNVYETPFDQIWNNPKSYKIFRERMGSIKDCEACEHSMKCQGGCRGVAYKTTNDFFTADPFCWNLEPKE